MTVLYIEHYEDARFVNTRYRYDSIKTGIDAKDFLEELVASGIKLTQISVDYSTEGGGAVPSVEASSFDEFVSKYSFVYWKYIESIRVHGVNNGICFNGEIVPLDNGGYFKYSVPKNV